MMNIAKKCLAIGAGIVLTITSSMPVLASCNIYNCDTCGLGTISITRYYTNRTLKGYEECQKIEGAYDPVYFVETKAHEECNYCHVGYDYLVESKYTTECSH